MIVFHDELNRFNKRRINTNKDTLDSKYHGDKGLRSEENNLNSTELGDMYYNNALDLAEDNNISKAIDLLEKSLEYNDKDIEALNLLGIFHYIFCNFNKAKLNWNKSLNHNSQNNRARYYIESLNSDKFKSFIEYYNLSIKYIERFQYKDAIELLFEISKTNKDLIEPYALLGNCYYALQDYDLAQQYFKKALTMDADNIKYLKYLNKINGSIPLKTKTKVRNKDIDFKFKIASAFMAMIVIVLGLIFYRNYNKNIRQLALELEKSKTENTKLKDELAKNKEENIFTNTSKQDFKQEPKTEESDTPQEGQEEKEEPKVEKELEKDNEIDSLSFKGTEPEIFEEAMRDYKSEKYKDSIDKLKFLIRKGTNEDLVAESIYFIAVLLEKEKDYDKSAEYYNLYINKYRERSYYDDSLYNYGLMLYEKGDVEESKKVLKKLKKDEPNSEFVNSKVKAILDN